MHSIPSRVVTPPLSVPENGFRPVVLAPTHNNAATLAEVLHKLELLNLEIIVVNDGSTDQTASILQDWSEISPAHHVCTHAQNRGKAAALQTGFTAAIQAGFTHAVTIDTDGQLSAEDIPKLLDKSASHESALVLGVRNANASDYPGKSRWGRRISNALVRIEAGKTVHDSQCGLRVYPLKFVCATRCKAGHYGFETEIITRAGWAGIPILESPVQCRYFDEAHRVSHFKPIVDSVRALAMHARLLAVASYPFARKNSFPGSAPRRSLPRQFFHWLNPITAWKQIRHHEGARTKFAAGFAAGIFLANMPFYGMQTIVALFVARRFRLHPVSIVAGVNIAVPPINAVMIAMGIATGHFILHGNWPHLQSYHWVSGHMKGVLLPILLEWIVGSIVLGALMGAISFVLMDAVLRFIPDGKPPSHLAVESDVPS